MISPARFNPSAKVALVHSRATEADYARLKTGAKHLLPDLKASHRLEIVARAFGWSTAAAMQAAFRDLPEGKSLALDASPTPMSGLEGFTNWTVDELAQNAPALAPSLVAWLSRSRFKIQHPKDDPWVISGAFASIEGLLNSILEHQRLARFIGIPGQIGSPAWLSTLPAHQHQDLKPVAHHASLAAALALGAGLTADEIAGLTRDDLEFNHAHVQRQYLDAHDGIEFGEMVGKLADLHLLKGEGAPQDPAFMGADGPLTGDQLDALVFDASSIAGQPSTIEDLRLASAILSTALGCLSPEGCSARLGLEWQDIQKALPNETRIANRNWASRLAGLARLPGMTDGSNRSFHIDVFRRAGPVQPLLDEWLALIGEVEEARQSGLV